MEIRWPLTGFSLVSKGTDLKDDTISDKKPMQYNTLPRSVVHRRSPVTYPRGHGQQLPTSVFLLRVPQMF